MSILNYRNVIDPFRVRNLGSQLNWNQFIMVSVHIFLIFHFCRLHAISILSQSTQFPASHPRLLRVTFFEEVNPTITSYNRVVFKKTNPSLVFHTKCFKERTMIYSACNFELNLVCIPARRDGKKRIQQWRPYWIGPTQNKAFCMSSIYLSSVFKKKGTLRSTKAQSPTYGAL